MILAFYPTLLTSVVFAFALTVDVVAAFGVTFTTPYLLGDPGANLGGRIGWLFFAYCVASFLFVLFFLPELKGVSLHRHHRRSPPLNSRSDRSKRLMSYLR